MTIEYWTTQDDLLHDLYEKILRSRDSKIVKEEFIIERGRIAKTVRSIAEAIVAIMPNPAEWSISYYNEDYFGYEDAKIESSLDPSETLSTIYTEWLASKQRAWKSRLSRNEDINTWIQLLLEKDLPDYIALDPYGIYTPQSYTHFIKYEDYGYGYDSPMNHTGQREAFAELINEASGGCYLMRYGDPTPSDYYSYMPYLLKREHANRQTNKRW